MRRSACRLVTLVAVGALALGACGGSSDDVSDLVDAGQSPSDDEALADPGSSSDGDDDTLDESGPGFGEFVSGSITVSGAEDLTYSIDDPAYTYFGAGGCGGGEFAITINATEADTGYTALQVIAPIDADIEGGGTGTFDVEELTVIKVTDGDLGASRSYDGPGSMSITEHDPGGPTAVPNTRRMAFTITGSLAASGPDSDGEVEVAADLLWVMGCP